jgi:hypothetical protein
MFEIPAIGGDGVGRGAALGGKHVEERLEASIQRLGTRCSVPPRLDRSGARAAHSLRIFTPGTGFVTSCGTGSK